VDSESKTILLIHSLWLTPRSWELFKGHYEEHGYRVLAPGWPDVGSDHTKQRREISAFKGLGIEEIADHYHRIVHSMNVPPILIGHGFGGLIVQILLDRGLGSAGVAINSMVPKGCWKLTFPLIRKLGPFLINPLNYGDCVTLSFDRFYAMLANAMTETDARVIYGEQVIPAPGRPLFQAALANFLPDSALKVNRLNNRRSPLLLITGNRSRLSSPESNWMNYKFYSHSTATTDFADFANRSDMSIVESGWKEIADFAVSWSKRRQSNIPAGMWRSPENALAPSIS
jgi:pimeloyl-ACP methyl ester carboxylesterase